MLCPTAAPCSYPVATWQPVASIYAPAYAPSPCCAYFGPALIPTPLVVIINRGWRRRVW
jgi:hypothetical protein